MADLLSKLHELREIPAELHWFCQSYDTVTPSAETSNGSIKEKFDLVKAEESAAVSVEYRRDLVAECLQLFAYEGEDVLPHQEYLTQQIDWQLGKCDTCIVEYYTSKHQKIEKLRQDYDEEEIAEFFRLIDDRDIKRITRGLESATRTLKAAEPQHRNKNLLDLSTQLSLFEALSCQAFLARADLVQQHLQVPFELVQRNSRLTVAHYVPAATHFVFGSNRYRLLWAIQTWRKYRKPLSKKDFDFAVRDPLLQILRSATEPVTDLALIQRLWCGVRLIVDRLDNDLITHSLRAMEVDIFRIALEHLQYNTPGFRFLLQTFQKLLEIAPNAFWESMGAISPTTVIEQVFNNAQYDKVLEEARESDDFEISELKDMLSWIKPFLESLQMAHQAQACRSLAFQLLDRLQANKFPVYARIECYRVGLGVLNWTLSNCNKDDSCFEAVGRVVAAETLEVVSTYIKRILTIPTLPATEEFRMALEDQCLRAVKVSLALECNFLRMFQDGLKQKKDLSPGFCSYSPAIWDAVVHHLDRGNIVVAKAALIGVNGLTGLEKFRVNANDAYTKGKSEYNATFGRLTHSVCLMLERINDFNSGDVETLFSNFDTATALIATLFSPDASTYEAGVNLIESISSATARREAIGHILSQFFVTTLNSVSWCVRRIAHNETFASCPRMLKTCTDVLDVLCDSHSGLLRTRQLINLEETTAVENFWEHQWEALRVIYEKTEGWGSARVSGNSVMKEFCRDTMQFSDHFFDKYSIFAGASESTILNKQEDGIKNLKPKSGMAGKELLKHPARTMEAMVKWLRLRDLYLAATSVKLTEKVLNRLSEKGMLLAEAPRDFLEKVVRGSPQGRTLLTPKEKAELARALEVNLGRPISSVDTDNELSDMRSQASAAAKVPRASGGSLALSSARNRGLKSGTIDLPSWKAKANPSNQSVDVSNDEEFGDSELLNEDILAASLSVDLLKKQLDERAHQTSSNRASPAGFRDIRGSSGREKQAINTIRTETQIKDDRTFRQNREKDREAKKKRDAEVLAKVKKISSLRGITEQTSREGSVFSNLGVHGKDHAPKASGMMVSSGSETDSGNELDNDLFGRAERPPRMSDAVKEYHASRVKQAKEQGPIKKMRQLRSAKDMRARLAPDLTSLHKTILGWEFFHNGDFPPGSDREDYSLVTSTFRNPTDYQNVFEPLLVLEAWQGFLKAKEEGNFKGFEVKVANRLTVDNFVEISTTLPIADGRELGIGEADIVLMSKASVPTTEAQQPHCLARVFKVTRKKASMEISYRVNLGSILLASMVPNAVLYGVKILSITPLEREYGALQGLKYFDLCDEITKAKPSPLLKYSEKQLSPLAANYKINTAQAKAVRSAIDNDAFTLIQGPPGSGKTKTIVAIVGGLMTGSFVDKGVAVARPPAIDGKPQQHTKPSVSKKLLVCAPSNAAVDELVMRLKQGVKTVNGETQKLSVVRIGRSDAINANVLDVTLEELVNAKLNLTSGKKTDAGEDIHKIMIAHKSTCEELNTIRSRIEERKSCGKPVASELERDFDLLKRKKQQLSTRIDTVRDSGDTMARDAEISRRKVQQEILDNAHVICATLSGSGHEMFQSLNIEFETVIIDEAAQSIELSALIPLKYGCSRCILVGDPKQLPPTVLSREAARFQYEQSLFVRMQTNHPDDVHLLDTQYRMHPEISSFPSKAFYDGKLLDGQDMAELRAKPWHDSAILGPYRFFDVHGTHQKAFRSHSLINVAEIEVALKLYGRLVTDYKTYSFEGKIGIITPYKSQLRELRSRFAQKYGESIFSRLEFNTTDAFQGRESEVIIFSCVRAAVSRGIGFLSDIRRMNVGITRAKSSLWVLGNSQSLKQGEYWGELIEDAKSRNCYTHGDVLGLLGKPLSAGSSKVINMNPDSSRPTASGQLNNDIKMPDAPMIDCLGSSDVCISPLIRPPIDEVMVDASFDMSSRLNARSATLKEDIEPHIPHPYGGLNGLNTNNSYYNCGSTSHSMNSYEDPEAKGLTADSCFRCHSLDHTKMFCTGERCLNCGKMGHSANTCTSSEPLPNDKKSQLKNFEANHQRLLLRAPEIRQEKQLGDHDNEVPTVLVTSERPSPIQRANHLQRSAPQNLNKRKRVLSPPSEAPTAPASFSMASVASTTAGFTRNPTNNISAGGPAAVGQPTSLQTLNARRKANPVRVPFRYTNDLPALETSGQLDTAAIPTTAAAQRNASTDSDTSGITAEPQAAPRPLLPSQSQVRPQVKPHMKKRKEANPFIIPKTKNRR